MDQQIRRFGKWLLVLGPLAVLVLLLVPEPAPVQGASFSTPFWSNTSPSIECACSHECGCAGPSEWSEEDVSKRTLEARYRRHLFSVPGKTQSLDFSFVWRSHIDGGSQLGQGIVCGWETSAERSSSQRRRAGCRGSC
jgi:hypothetical protein